MKMIKRNIKSVSEARKFIRKKFGEVEEDKSKNLFDIREGVIDTRVVYNYSKKTKKSKGYPIKYAASYIPFKNIIIM